MNRKEKYGIALLLVSIFLLQIWVADAESKKIEEKSVSDFSTVTQQAASKILNDNDLRKSIGSQSSAQDAVSQKVRNKVIKRTKEKKAESEFVWYKPWTWFK